MKRFTKKILIKRLCFGLLISMFGWPNLLSALSGPLLDFGNSNTQVGKIAEGEVKIISLAIKNIGDKTLIIDGLDAKCGLALNEDPKIPIDIQPGNKKTISVKVKGGDSNSSFRRVIHFLSNDSVAKDKSFIVEGEEYSEYRFSSVVKKVYPKTKSVEFDFHQLHNNVTIKKIEFDNKSLELKLNKNGKVVFSPKEVFEEGFNSLINVYTSSKFKEKTTLRVYVQSQSKLSLSNEKISFGELKKNQEALKSIFLKTKSDDVDISLGEVFVDNVLVDRDSIESLIQFKQYPTKSGKQVKVYLSSKNKEWKGRLRTNLVFQTPSLIKEVLVEAELL